MVKAKLKGEIAGLAVLLLIFLGNNAVFAMPYEVLKVSDIGSMVSVRRNTNNLGVVNSYYTPRRIIMPIYHSPCYTACRNTNSITTNTINQNTNRNHTVRNNIRRLENKHPLSSYQCENKRIQNPVIVVH